MEELLQSGYEVVGLDNLSKDGPVEKTYDRHRRYRAVTGDAKDVRLFRDVISACDHLVAGAAIIGGIS